MSWLFTLKHCFLIFLANRDCGFAFLQVKQAVVGYGRADKHQVQTMVKTILNLREIPKPDDAADALAVAICHANTSDMPESFKI